MRSRDDPSIESVRPRRTRLFFCSKNHHAVGGGSRGGAGRTTRLFLSSPSISDLSLLPARTLLLLILFSLSLSLSLTLASSRPGERLLSSSSSPFRIRFSPKNPTRSGFLEGSTDRPIERAKNRSAQPRSRSVGKPLRRQFRDSRCRIGFSSRNSLP